MQLSKMSEKSIGQLPKIITVSLELLIVVKSDKEKHYGEENLLEEIK